MNAPAQTTGGQLTTKAAGFNQFLQKHKGQLEAALPKHLNADRMIRLALTAFSQNKALGECSQNSVFASIIVASQLGLEPNVNGQGYLIPYKGTCTFVAGWKGLVDLVSRSGRANVWTGAVFEGDEFDYMLGDDPYCRHKPTGDFEASKLTHVYAIGRIKDSAVPVIEVWTVKKVEAHLKKWNKVGNSHYALADSRKNFEMYARKVALLQVLKYMPQSIELAAAMDVESAQSEGRNVTVDANFVVVDQGENLSQSNEVSELAPEVLVIETDDSLSYDQIKKMIIQCKNINGLEVLAADVNAHTDADERSMLIKMCKAKQAEIKKQAQADKETEVTVEVAKVTKVEPKAKESEPDDGMDMSFEGME
jgi:recombination protein RecT